MPNSSRISRRAFVKTAVGTAALAASGSHLLAQSNASVPVRFAGQSFSAEMGRVVAKNLGYDKEFGVDWNFLTFRGANEISEALISGQAETGGIGSFASIAMGANDAPVKVAFAYCYGGDRTAIVARKDSGIKSIKDLAGRKVGSRLGGIDNTMLMIALSKEGMEASSVEIVNMRAEDIPAALAAGLIDAASGTEPSNSVWVENGLGDVVARGGQYLAAYAFGHLTDAFIDEEPDAAYATVLAYAKGMWWGRHNEAEAARMVAQEFNQDEATVASSMRWLIYDPRLKALALESEEESADLLLEDGRIRKLPEFSTYHHKQFIERAETEHPELFSDLDAYVTRKQQQ